MENTVKNSHDKEFQKKSRSLDLKSLYRPNVTEVDEEKNVKRKISAEDGDVQRVKKIKKRLSISSLRNGSSSSKGRKSLDEVYDGALDRRGSNVISDLNQKSNRSSGIEKNPLGFDENDVQIPKRKRGLIGRKKLVADQVSKVVRQSDCKEDLVDHTVKLNGKCSVARNDSWKIKEKKCDDNLKENIKSTVNSTCHLKEEDGHGYEFVVDNKDLPSKKSRRKSRKGKFVLEGYGEGEVSAGTSTKKCNYSREDEEENLEENAARMLSSRFDPSCTGFTVNSKPFANGLSVFVSNGHEIVSQHSKSSNGVESESADGSGRILRPRKVGKDKKRRRKRRHFYEVFYKDSDAYWVLNRRIKVFWPLDQSWYFGCVNDYNKEINLHHVKYDDREEEWVDLQNERFKLLLLPTEVHGKGSRKKIKTADKISDTRTEGMQYRKCKERKDLTIKDEGCGTYMDSEPIISWLARSSHRVKSSSSHVLKKQKTFDPGSKLSEKALNVHEYSNEHSLGSYKNHFLCKSDFLERVGSLAEGERSGMSASGSTSCSKEGQQSIVYFRRKFRKTSIELSHLYEGDCVSRFIKRSLWDVSHSSVASVSSVVMDVEHAKENGYSLGRSDPNGKLRCTDDEGFLALPLIESEQFKFELSLLGFSFLLDSIKVENNQWFHALMLLQYGTLMTMWPIVSLKMLFVDNVVGLRFLLFDGCLRQAVALVFLVLTMFNSTEKQYAASQLPLTSIELKISCIQGINKHLDFLFSNFSEITNSKWIHLDNSLKRCCLMTKQIPLAECTYDNIKALQNGLNHFSVAHGTMQFSFVKGLQKQYKPGNRITGASEAAFANISHSSLYYDKMNKSFPPFSLSFTAAPTFFLGVHAKKLIERCITCIQFGEHESVEDLENSSSLNDSSSFCDITDKGTAITLENSVRNSKEANGWLSCPLPEFGAHLFDIGDRNLIEASDGYHNGHFKDAKSSAMSVNPENNFADVIEQSLLWQNQHKDLDKRALELMDSDNKEMFGVGDCSFLEELNVKFPTFNKVDKPIDEELRGAKQAIDWNWKMNAGTILSPNPTGPRSTWHRNKNNLSSSGLLSRGRSDGKTDLFNNGFGNGPKKSRTQFSYTLPFGGVDYSMKTKVNHQKGLPHKRIRRANEKRSIDISRGCQRNLELLFSEANLLITLGDRGWRECGARIMLELLDHIEWKLVVKISGITKYSYKAHQFLQPGSTNRYTHAMMWKGGKDWTLEFPDRSQWALFKEMHEECYNRNVRAASVKNIPIPGVHLIEENDENITDSAFFHISSKYFRQVETDVEMALNPSSILYDMDSEDEDWIMNAKSSSEVDSSGMGEISDDVFEKTMDIFEKAAYTRQIDQFTKEEMEELMAGGETINLIIVIYKYWRKKRQRKGLPLIRHLQPPLWERYQQQLKDWELSITKNCTGLRNGFQEKPSSTEKPPMFAFCLKPRGLDVPNKGSKQRSHRKFSMGSHSNAIPGDHDTFHGFGRRLNGFGLADETIAYSDFNHEVLDDSPLIQTSPRLFSLQDAGSMGYTSMSYDEFDRNTPPIHRTKTKKYGQFLSCNDPETMTSYNQRTINKRNGVDWHRNFPAWKSQRQYQAGIHRHYIQQLDPSDLDEFRLRDASGAAKDANNTAKHKRERAKRMLLRADLAIHKAVVALMTAEAIKTNSGAE